MEQSEVGKERPRREDPALVTGSARYTDDFQPDELVHAAFLRCPYGHARVESVDVDPALERDDVLAAFGAADLAAAGGPTGIRVANQFPGGGDTFERPVLVGDRVRFAGEPVAVVLAEDRYVAHEAVEAIEVRYERLPARTDPRDVDDPDGPTISDVGEDVVEWNGGDEAATDRAFDEADHVVSLDLSNPRLISSPMETRAVLAEYDGEPLAGGGDGADASSRLTVTTSTQTPHQDRDRIAETLDLSTDRVHVLAPAVGGGFGPKGARPYPEEPVVAWCAMYLGRPVKWAATRTEGHRTDNQGRDVYVHGELALDDDGAIRGLRIRGQVGIGGYPARSPAFALRPQLTTGAYEVPAVHSHLTGVLTNTPMLGPYRGAGRPEAIYVVERLVDRAATELGVDPAELRRQNFVPPDAFPYETRLGHTYDSGEYERALERALEMVGYEARRREQAEAREDGRYVGVGIASFVENTGSAGNETARVELNADGTVTAFCGTADHGQGHGTTYAQLMADEFGVAYEDVDVREGDTDELPSGTGTYASRSVAVGGTAIVRCARDVVEAATDVAAEHLEVDPSDVVFEDGAFAVAGAPDRSVSLSTVAGLAAEANAGAESEDDGAGSGDSGSADDAHRPALSAEQVYEPEGETFAFGTHVAVVEVDPESGEIDVLRYVGVDDCGTQINPKLVEGQVHGAVAQGLGQALWEGAVFDDNGTLVTGSFQDYAMPRAERMPELETDSTVTPSPITAHGGKGAGEAGTIAAPPAVVNAVVDALSPFGVEDVPMPMTPQTVWRAISEAE